MNKVSLIKKENELRLLIRNELEDITFNPENINKDEFKEKFEEAKAFLLEMENNDETLSKYAKTMANIYTLWSVVILNRDSIPKSPEAAKRYSDFMELVSQFKEHPDSKPETLLGELASKYRNNSLGASTDLKQRAERHDALLEALKWEE